MEPMHARSQARLTVVLLLLLTACGSDADRQAADQPRAIPPLRGPDLVPKELVEALLAHRVGPDRQSAELLPGKLPSNLPFEVPSPDGARVVGSFVQESWGTIVFGVRETALDAMRAYENVLRRSDWRVRGGGGGGFRSADFVHASYCHGDKRSLSISGVDRREGGAFLQVSYGTHRRASSYCDEGRRDALSPRGPLPTLYPPRGTTVLDAGGGSGSSHTAAHARLKTQLSLPQLIAHYGQQVRAEGWSQQSESASSDLIAQTSRFEDSEGRVWIGVLLAQSIPDTEERAVMFRAVPRELQRP